MIFHKNVVLLIIFLIVGLNLMSVLFNNVPVSAAGYITRTIAVINSSGAIQNNFSIESNLNTSAEISASRMRADCGDIRVYTSSTNIELDYAILYCNTTYTSIVFLVPSLPTGVSTYSLTFGDPVLASNENPTAVFELYEMFTSAPPTCSLAGSAVWDNSNNWLRLTPTTSQALGTCNYTSFPSTVLGGFIAFFDVYTGGTGTSSQATWLYTFDAIIPTLEDIVHNGVHYTVDDGQDRVCATTQTAINGAGSCDLNLSLPALDNSTWRRFKISGDILTTNISIDGTPRLIGSITTTPDISNTNFGFAGRNGITPAERRIRNFAVIRFYKTITDSIAGANARPIDSLSISLRNSTDTANFANLCDFGTLNVTTLSSCQYRLKISTNARNGYTVYARTSGGLQTGTTTITDASAGSGGGSGGTAMSAGTENYGVLLSPGSCTSGMLSPAAAFSPATGNSVRLNYTTATAVLSCNGPNNPLATDPTNTTLINLQAAISGDTPPGNYTQTITWTVVPNY